MSDRSLERRLSLHTPYLIHAPDGGVLYDLGAQSHIKVLFEMAESMPRDVDTLGTLRLPDAIRTCGFKKVMHIKFYRVSTSELYALQSERSENKTSFCLHSPYGVATMYVYWIMVSYPKVCGMYA